MSAFEVSLMIVNEKMYLAGIIDERTKDRINLEIQRGLKKKDGKAIMYPDLAPDMIREETI